MFGRLYQLPSAEAQARPTSCSSSSSWPMPPTGSSRPTRAACAAGSTSASALIGRPRLLFLDEPTTGLDPRSRLGMWDVIRGLVREGTTLLLTTQYLEEADALADTIAVVDHGQIIARGTADELKSQVGGERIEVVVRDRAAVAARDGDRCRADCHGEVDARRAHPQADRTGQRWRRAVLVQVVRDLDEAGIAIDDIGLRRPTLDDVFLALTGHAAELAAAADGEPPGTAKEKVA